MATSGTYAITMTGAMMAHTIARLLGGVSFTDSLHSNEQTYIIQAVNMWLLQKKGGPHHLNPGQMMWTRETADLTLSSKSVYDLKPSGGDLDIQIPVEILTATLKDTDDNETPLAPMSLEKYQSMPNKGETGTPARFYYEKRIDVGKFYLDFIPSDTTDVVDIVYRQPLEVISAGANEFDIEDFWFRAIKFNVALDFAPEYGQVDPNRLQILEKKAGESMAAVGSFYPEETSYHFQPGID